MDWSPKDIVEALQEISKLIFGGQIPPVVAFIFGWGLFISIALAIIWLLLFLISKIIDVVKEKIWPVFYNIDEKRRNLRRRRFAEHIDNEIRFLNRQEAWSDYRFAELEAEVEAEGQRRLFSFVPFLKRTQTGLRREKSLSKALANSEDRLILLEGEPGAGKSVALRHLTTLLAQGAAKSSNNNTVIPIYINLKELRKIGVRIDRPQIYEFVLKSLNRVNDRDVEEFLDAEFDRGMQAGTWLFLFDSFDEIPDVLSSTEADATIREYANAISDFLHGMNQCRGVIASRQFRGPGAMGWPKFKVLQLSESRQLELIQNSGMEPGEENIFIGILGVASQEIKSMVTNPMFLGLVCDHYKMNKAFPENPHSVFETYIDSRFMHDEERVQRRFGLSVKHLRTLAENIAFCMAADSGLGLSPTRSAIKDALARLKFTYSEFHKTLDALEFMKIARSDTSSPGESQPFTFAHRRFQEYFATSVVLREPGRVSARELLLNARWRETAVVVCQTQSVLQLKPIYENVTNILAEIVAILRLSFPDIDSVVDYYLITPEASKSNTKWMPSEVEPFLWPKHSLHLLGLLQSGFGNQLSKLPKEIRKDASKIVIAAYANGTLLDAKWALEVAGCIASLNLPWMIRNAFRSSSQLLNEVAYRQIAYLGDISDEIARSIRLALIELFVNNRLEREKNATYAHLSRLPKSGYFLEAFRLLRVIRLVDFLLMSVLFLFTTWFSSLQPALAYLWLALAFLLPFSYWLLTRTGDIPSRRSWVPSILILDPLGIALRLVAVFSPLFFLVAGRVDPKISTLFFQGWVIIALICLFWAPFSFSAVLTGKFLSPFWWLMMFLFPVIYLFTNFSRTINSLWKSIVENIKSILSGASFIILAVCFFYLLLELAQNFIVLLILFAISFFLSLSYGAIFLYSWVHDKYLLKKILDNGSILSVQDFIRYHPKFYTISKRNQFVEYIRLKNILKTSSQDFELLQWYCIFTENLPVRFWRMRHRNIKLYHPIIYFIKKNWYYDSAYKKRLRILLSEKTGCVNAELPRYGSKFRDEIYALLEQVSILTEKD